jgi:rod shape-determining protein MreD
MMARFGWLITVAVAALLQTTWPETLKMQDVLPDFILLLTVFFALNYGEELAMYTGLIGGLYQDTASNKVLGHHVLCLVIVGFVVGRLSNRLITDHPAIKAGIVLIAALFHGLLFTFVAFVQDPSIGAMYTIATSVVPGAFYTAVLTPLVFMVLGWFFRPKPLSLTGGAA